MPDKVLKIFKFDMSKRVCSFKKCHYRAVKKILLDVFQSQNPKFFILLTTFQVFIMKKTQKLRKKIRNSVLPVKHIVKLGAREAGGRRGTNICPC